VQLPVSSALAASLPALFSMLVPPLLVTALAAPLVSACSADGFNTTKVVAKPQAGSSEQPTGLALAERNVPTSRTVEVSPRQRMYLDALTAAGVDTSPDLMALSIGSYVCQARAAGQDDRAVWDFVLPLVRGDVVNAGDSAAGELPGKPAMSVHDTTVAYIRIASERLC
jgi:hypothetical protein